jgi:hypothetical protein
MHGRRTTKINRLLASRRRCPSRSCNLRRRPTLLAQASARHRARSTAAGAPTPHSPLLPINTPNTFPCTYTSSPVCSPYSRRPPRRHGRSRRPPCLAAGALSCRSLPGPSKQGNRPLGTQGPSPTRARPVPAGGSPEFGRTAAGRHPGAPLRSHSSF